MANQDNFQLEYNASLMAYHTFRTPTKAKATVEIHQEADWETLIQKAQSEKQQLLILGEGSNVLFMNDQPCWVAINKLKGIRVIEETTEEVIVEFGGGENWHTCVEWAVQKNWGGIENLALIPGTVGAAPIQNIGAYGVELQDVFVDLDAIHLQDGTKRTFNIEECKFAYRDSIFKQAAKGQYVVTKVRLRLTKNPIINTSYKGIDSELRRMKVTAPTIKDIFDAVVHIRQTKLPNPTEIYNAGSFFKNPVVSKSKFQNLQEDYPNIIGYPVANGNYKIPAAWLLEKAGWKGKRRGDAGFYQRHALVLVNHGHATGDELKNLAWDALDDVYKKFGVLLKPEVWIF